MNLIRTLSIVPISISVLFMLAVLLYRKLFLNNGITKSDSSIGKDEIDEFMMEEIGMSALVSAVLLGITFTPNASKQPYLNVEYIFAYASIICISYITWIGISVMFESNHINRNKNDKFSRRNRKSDIDKIFDIISPYKDNYLKEGFTLNKLKAKALTEYINFNDERYKDIIKDNTKNLYTRPSYFSVMFNKDNVGINKFPLADLSNIYYNFIKDASDFPVENIEYMTSDQLNVIYDSLLNDKHPLIEKYYTFPYSHGEIIRLSPDELQEQRKKRDEFNKSKDVHYGSRFIREYITDKIDTIKSNVSNIFSEIDN